MTDGTGSQEKLKLGTIAELIALPISLISTVIALYSLYWSGIYNAENSYDSLLSTRAAGCYQLFQHYERFAGDDGKPIQLIIDGKTTDEKGLPYFMTNNQDRATKSINFAREINLCTENYRNVGDLEKCISAANVNPIWLVNDDLGDKKDPQPHPGKWNSVC